MSNKKVGQYAVTSIDFNTWFGEESNVKVVPKNKKQKTKKKIVYQIFSDMALVVPDIFWVKKFNLWASGKIPKYFTVNNNVISYNKSSTSIDCVLDQDVDTNAKLCIQFFKTYGGIFSKIDEYEVEKELSSEIPSETTEPEPKTWTQCDKKSQELMIKVYTNQLSDSLNLTNKEYCLLLQTLRLAVSAKNFNKSNIVIDNGKIIDIKGLLWDSNTKKFKLDYVTTNTQHKKTEVDSSDEECPDITKDMIPQFNQKIKKYYELYEKKYEKYN